MKKEKGITMIALIVTIIVLLILAGITIATITSDNGIIRNANDAKEQTEIGNEKEVVDRAVIQAMGNNSRGNIVEDELQEQLDKITGDGETEVKMIRKKLVVEFLNSHRMYHVDDNGNVYEYIYKDLPIMEYGSNFNERMNDYKASILTVTVLDNINIPENSYKIFDVSKNQDESVKAWLVENSENTNMYDLYIGGEDGVNIENCSSMFSSFSECTNIDLENLYTENVEVFSSMFANCSKLININLSNIDTSKATTMGQLFFNCSSIEKIDLSNFDTANVTTMNLMFGNCNKLKYLDVSYLDTGNVTNMIFMFTGCGSLLTIDVSNWDTSKVTSMARMFCYCQFTSIDVSNWDTSNVIDMSYMFIGCAKLKELDLSNWNTANVNNMSYMFNDCKNLTNIYVSASTWIIGENTNTYGMFISCGVSQVTIK
mgnify:CR=1 FL=1